ncbi:MULTISPECIES: ArsC family reductase [Tatumella]|uniref:ArsC family reductase n=1 Tax=Tatumella TaxID=82986 RepID=UPI0004704825|nr:MULTISPECIES: ArsC family reductase [Tatumella]
MINNETTPELTLYGIKNCDTVRKARRFLEEQGIAFRFHDYRADGIDSCRLSAFVDALGYETLLNKRGTTWRKLPEDIRDSVQDSASAVRVMLEHPAVIKRPLLCATNGKLLAGFSPSTYLTFIQENT